MYVEHLIQFAVKQTAILVAVLFFIPMLGVTASVLLTALTAFLCTQLPSTLILSVVITSLVLAVKLVRGGQ